MTTPEPTVSVIIAVRNGERFLAQAIESVLAQTLAPLEIVVVDGQSTDATANIAGSLPLVRVVLQTNLGVADAYNLGIAASRGDLIAFLSHDDLWTPDKLAQQTGALATHPAALYSVARVRFFLEPGTVVPPGFRPGLLRGDHPARIMETLVARREAFCIVGAFDASLDISEDIDWFARANDLGVPYVIVERVLLLKRVHDANTSLNAPSMYQSMLRALRASIRRKRALSPASQDPESQP
jgi:glycosyltransferase involved in cell wall biosynthesis